MRLASPISQLRNWLLPCERNGITEKLSTPSRYLLWAVEKTPYEIPSRVTDSSGKVVCQVYNLDDAESIVREHNRLVQSRWDWFDAKAS